MFLAEKVAERNGIPDLRDRARKAALDDVGLLSNDELRALVLHVEAARASLDAAEGHALAELEARNGCDIDVGLSTAGWLTDRGRVPRAVASSRVRVANKLRRDLPPVDLALGEGRISFDHARVLACAANPRVAEVFAELQDALVDAAEHAPFEVWRREVRGIVELVDQDGGHDPDADLARNQLHANWVGDELHIRGALVGEHALSFRQIVDTATDALWRRYRNDHERCPELAIPARSTLRALALQQLVLQGHAAGQTGPGPAVDITLVIHARPSPDADDQGGAERHDYGDCAGKCAPEPDDCEAGVEGDAKRWMDWVREIEQLGRFGPAGLTTLDGEPLRPAGLTHLLCDPIITRLTLDANGVPLDMSRQVRFATPAQRKALAIRDGGCAFPGCGHPAGWCDAHHIVYWEHDGDTDIANLVLLCRHHHGVIHRRGWNIRADPSGGFTITTPSGQTLHSHPAHAPPVAA
jgi:hypothetical protein